ncbi:PREDICTED: scavenger receptor cysteine-rich type 1 protein M130-like isoform X2 [Poecilia mexicana]|uniref:scavenger receptor cysteine-rich type 1 protein M130-like isoform X2 n=1 Tax=Poecilia mexicana TaxID=48701 RepID=UPI00072E6814|nr:PREDICTED: scavenger receptor cysteine-rich type 1 protein M130-like isoform X2 [Poecilia mexicana]
MWFLLLLLHTFAHFGPVNSADAKQGKIILRNENDANPCEGHVEVYYDNKMGYVGDKNWNNKTDEVVCKTTHCGQPMGNSNVYRSYSHPVWLNELDCKGNEASLWECDGWPGPSVSFYRKPTVKKVKCSYNISFHLEQHKCEGAVKYTIQSDKKETGYICNEGFGADDATRLCKSIPGCGETGKIVTSQWMRTEGFMSSQQGAFKKINCSGIQNVKHLWQCIESHPSKCSLPAAVSCTDHKRLQLIGNTSNVCSGQLEEEENDKWKKPKNQTIPDLCKKLHCGEAQPSQQNATNGNVHCPDKVKVLLTDDNDRETKCYGYVKIQKTQKNDEKSHVCGDDWTEKESEMVCKELNCGKVIKELKTINGKNGIMNHVKCTGSESSLWYCRAEHRSQKCTSAPYVVCQGSREVRLQDGPGKCAGRLEVKDEGQWKRVSKENWDGSYTKHACKQLDCGDDGKDKSDSDEFSQGTGEMLTFRCQQSDKNLADCTATNTNNQNRNEKAVQLICNENKLLFLDGPQSCSGDVAIEYKEELYWLSGSNERWNKELANKVCQQMHCGNAKRHNQSSPGVKNRMWNESFSCSSDQKSIFDCNKTQINSSNSTIAHVECEGNITVTLQHKCWGMVSISTGNETGYVSGEHWSDTLSKELCKELGCGTEILKPIKKPGTDSEIKFKSLFKMKNSINMRQYSIVKMEMNPESTKNQDSKKPAYVVCKGSIKPRFNDKDNQRHKCSGNVEVSYEGQWLPVSKKTLDNKETQNTICTELQCGNGLSSKPYFGPKPSENHVIIIQECSQKTIAECQVETAEMSGSNSQTSDLGGLHCSNWKTLALEDFGPSQTSSENICKGDLVVYSNKESEPKRNFVSSQEFSKDVGTKLCEAMKCGNYKRYRNSTELLKADNWYEGIFKCKNSNNIWDCETQKQQRDQNETAKLFIECDGEPTVKLSANGELSIDDASVCNSHWKEEYSHMVCQQLGRGNAIPNLSKNQRKTLTVSYHVHCENHNYLIGQCQRTKGRCNEGPVFIYCSRDMEFDTTYRCGGVLRIKYQKTPDKPVEVCPANFTRELSDKLCNKLNCGIFDSNKKKDIPQTKVEKSFDCGSSYKDPRYCVLKETCQNPTSFFCEGYQEPPTQPPPTEPTDPVPIIVGVLIVLILVSLIVVFVRYRIKRKNRKSMMPSDMEEADWDSGEYEDVDKSDEMGSFNRGRFRSDSDVEKERDVESNKSYNYDDVDEVTEAQPLTPQGSMVRAAKDQDLQDGVDKPSDDGVTYEVEDSQENYDDIDASPENAKTTAEVHDGPKPAPDDDEEGPKDQFQKNEDVFQDG